MSGTQAILLVQAFALITIGIFVGVAIRDRSVRVQHSLLQHLGSGLHRHMEDLLTTANHSTEDTPTAFISEPNVEVATHSDEQHVTVLFLCHNWKIHKNKGIMKPHDYRIRYIQPAKGNSTPTPPDVVVPLDCPSHSFVHSWPAHFRSIIIFGPTYGRYRQLDDKITFTEWMISKNFDDLVPRTYKPGDIEYPCFAKKRDGIFGRNSFLLTNAQDFNDTFVHGSMKMHNYIFQEAIKDNRETNVQLLVERGRILWSVVHDMTFKEDKQLFIRGFRFNRWVQPKSINKDFNISAFEQIIAELPDYRGFIDFDLKLKDGKVKILECNPRMGGSTYRRDFEEARIAVMNFAPKIASKSRSNKQDVQRVLQPY